MFKCFYPGVRYDSVYAIDFHKYYNDGYRAVLFDIDNTLVMHDAPANDKAQVLMKELHEMGMKTCLISNNDEPRIKPFAELVDCDYISDAGKPKRGGFERALAKLGVTRRQTMMVGDQLFTDMWGANRSNILSVYTKPIGRDPHFYIRLKRVGEAIVLFFYKFYERKHQGVKYLKECEEEN